MADLDASLEDDLPGGTDRPRRVGRSMLSLAAANTLSPFVTLITAPLLAHSLGVEGRGEVAVASVPYVLATVAATFGVPEAVTYFVARRAAAAHAVVRRAVVVVLASGLVVTAGLIAVSGWLADGDDDVQRLVVVGALAVIPALLVGLLRGTAAGLHRWSWIVRERVISASARLVGLGLLAFLGALTPGSATLVVVLSPTVGAISYLPLLRDLSAGKEDGATFGARTLVRYGARSWVGAVSGVLLFRLDQALMVPLAGAAELGLYAVAVATSEVPLIVTTAIRDVIFATDASDASDERLRTTARLCGLAAFIMGAAVVATMPVWFTFAFGDEFRDAMPIALVLTVAVVLGAPGAIMGVGLSARGRPELRSACLVVACTVDVVLILVLVPEHGAMGAAVATLVGNATTGFLAAGFQWRVFHLQPWSFYGVRRSDLVVLRRTARETVARLRSAG